MTIRTSDYMIVRKLWRARPNESDYYVKLKWAWYEIRVATLSMMEVVRAH